MSCVGAQNAPGPRHEGVGAGLPAMSRSEQATIAAGLHGIEQGIDPGPAFSGNAYADESLARVPHTLVDAITALEGSEAARAAFGDEVHHHLVNTARQEWNSFNRVVTDWERRRNFEQI